MRSADPFQLRTLECLITGEIVREMPVCKKTLDRKRR